MAAMNSSFRSSSRFSPEQAEAFTAEQRRLKSEAADRRAAAADDRAGGEKDFATAERPPAAPRRSKYLQ